VEISVSDTGPGIQSDALTRVFEPFFTTKAGGMGMGLSVSRMIVEAHGGRIWAENQGGGGAVFRLLLPAVAA
jgi:signal transduction histidine kinase